MENETFHEIDITKENMFSPSITESLQNIIYKEGFVTYKVYKKTFSTDGGNYTGSLFEVDIKGQTPDEEKEINLFVKKSINMTSDILSISCAYEKEQLFYDEFTKVFEDLEEKAKIPEVERLRTLKGYKVLSLDAIIMENLCKQGYTTLDRMEVFSLEFAELSIKQLATFHGLAFVLKEKKPEYFKSMLQTISKLTVNIKKYKKMLQNLFNITKSNLEEEWKNKLEPHFSKFADECLKYFVTDDSAMSWLCHGDYRQNNILMKTVNSKIVDLIPIDYQCLHIGSPLNDFFYFMYSGSDREFRKKHLVELKNLYYDTLKKFLEYFDIDVEDVYPRKKFEVDFDERRQLGLAIASIFYPLIFVTNEEAPSFETDDMTKVDFQVYPKYYERVMGVLEEFEELGYFSSSSSH